MVLVLLVVLVVLVGRPAGWAAERRPRRSSSMTPAGSRDDA
ncbi:MAG: hypothetical protein ACYDAQ_03375 [Mycobacteriales bacterium]